MRHVISLFFALSLSSFLSNFAIAQVTDNRSQYNYFSNCIDLQSDVKKNLRIVVEEKDCSVSKHYTLKGSKKVNIIYNTLDSLKVMSVGESKRGVNSSKLTIDSVDLNTDDFTFIYLPKRKYSSIMASSSNEKFSHSISLDDGVSWSKPQKSDFYTTSPAIYVHHKRDGALISYFFGDGNLTSDKKGEKSMLMMSKSFNGGLSWSLPEIAVKHNIFSLDGGTMAFYYNKNDKKAFKDLLYGLFYDKESGRAFYTISYDDGEHWSYPIEVEMLKNSSNYSLSIYKKYCAFTFTNSIGSGEVENIYLYISKTEDAFRKRKSPLFYKLYSVHKSDNRDDNLCVNSLLYRRDKLLLTIGNRWEENTPAYVKIVSVDIKNNLPEH